MTKTNNQSPNTSLGVVGQGTIMPFMTTPSTIITNLLNRSDNQLGKGISFSFPSSFTSLENASLLPLRGEVKKRYIVDTITTFYNIIEGKLTVALPEIIGGYR